MLRVISVITAIGCKQEDLGDSENILIYLYVEWSKDNAGRILYFLATLPPLFYEWMASLRGSPK